MVFSQQQQLVSELSDINWFRSGTEKAAIPLLNEYLALAAYWASKLDIQDGWLFTDFAKVIDPSISCDQQAWDQISHALAKGTNSGRDVTNKLMANALNWRALMDQGKGDYSLDPFAPIVAIVKSGWPIEKEHGYLQIGIGSLFIQPIEKYL